MAVKKKPSEGSMKISTLTEVVQKAVAELLTQAQDNIQEVLADSESKKITVNFKVDLDESETEPVVKIGIRFSEAYTDSRTTRLDDPGQIQLFRELPKSEEQELNSGDKEEGGD